LVTARLLARRWPLYALTCGVVFGLQVAFVAFVHVRGADFYAALVGLPLIVAVVTVFVGADALNTLTLRERWERIGERAWAIIVIDVGLSFVTLGALLILSEGTDAVDMVLGFLTMLLGGMLAYAEPFAALEEHVQTLMLLPFALLRSMMLAWVNMSRIFALLALQIVVALALHFIDQAAAHAGMRNVITVDLLLQSLVAAPLAALYTVAYLDTLSQERQALR
jgi:hypothetical protein